MTAFPALRPTSRPVTPGEWPSATHKAMDGGTVVVVTESVERGRTVSMAFENVTKADWELIRDHYRGQDSLFEGFYFQTITLDATHTPAGWWWRHITPPQCDDAFTNVRTVTCQFELVERVSVGFGGGLLTVSVEMVATLQPLPPAPPPAVGFGGGRLTVLVEMVARATTSEPRQNAVVHIPSIASGQTVTGYFDLPRRSLLLAFSTDRPGWLRLYASDAAAAADAARARATVPPLAAGVIADPVFVGAETMDLQPKLWAVSSDGGRRFPYRFTCDGGSGSATIVIYSEV